ncbi:MAG: isoprenylcysteine carboxyl methyltransferase [Actinophytocola sp.]|uniref:methyltransferase family protein n=1 Tax=Actinophytocola sp. TaxID=1872138 RepID=UPI001327DD18|nr:isoprenylcysteine carboxylmethyltransferase family protein [Actinophytocola sp.]MPZ84275.1 isoprenylcysteine carboxyl methyltransferase [Actinophytocola sp.]
MRAVVGSVVFFVVAPGTVVGLVPWLLTGWTGEDPAWAPVSVKVVGWVLFALGVAVLVHAFVKFVVDGLGTPFPADPPRHLVVGGLYRYVRNPMYVAIAVAVVGQALLLGRANLLVYAVVAWAVTAAFVRWREEPVLARRFGADYDLYRRSVRAWWPRLRPWVTGALSGAAGRPGEFG